jgi:hypothetical protein
VPELLDVASVPATIVNWAGAPTTLEGWCTYLGELTGLEPKFEVTKNTIGSVTCDLTRMHELIGKAKVDWRDGIRRMVEARAPELLARKPEPSAAVEPETEPEPDPEPVPSPTDADTQPITRGGSAAENAERAERME